MSAEEKLTVDATPPTAVVRGPELQISQLNLRYGQHQILKNLDFSIAAGSIQAIIGPNGGGKSSLLRCLLGLAPHRGEVRLRWPGAPGRIGYVPQAIEFDRSLPMTVLDFIRALSSSRPAFLPVRKSERLAIEAALERVGLAGKLQRRMGDLSGGERQRVMMAQGLIPEPDLLLLDEPMAALDEAGVAVFQQLLGELRQQGVTLIWVEHDLEAVRRLADQVVAINQQLLFAGKASEVLTAETALALFSHHYFSEQED